MRTFTRSFSLLAAFLLPFALWANVIVKGTVRYSGGLPATNYAVYIQTDSSVSACLQYHVRYTNANGAYQDTLICNNPVSQVIVSVANCNGATIHRVLPVGSNGVVESNFEVCLPVTCRAGFNWSRSSATPLRILFADSSHAATPNDSIVKRYWSFGDSTYDSTHVNPEHTYPHAGAYNACLKIVTRNGCISQICQTIQVGQFECRSAFTFSPIANVINRIKFNSESSYAGSLDSIISRRWNFGDGTSADGNIITPEHQYPGPGIYNVCLTIKTRLGCEKIFCAFVIIQSQVSCHAEFSFEVLAAATTPGSTVRFHSQQSTTATGDSIVSRKWNFGDGQTLDGNIKDPLHTYAQPGTYNVCLLIASARGCRDSICKVIVIPARHCEAVFNTDTLQGSGLNVIRFNSAASHGVAPDNIISRKWKFGDGTGISSGNEVNPQHVYAHPGQYNACLIIVTAGGCTDSVCHTVYIPGIITRCEPRFTRIATGLAVNFNSAPTGIAPGDSIINRFWTFGDGSSASSLAVVNHTYLRAGEYEVCLRIQTRGGCMQTWCTKFAVVNITGNCVPYFTSEQTAPRTIRVNSSASYSQLAGDSIIGRNWDFGDGQTLAGNNINPLHQYSVGGSYTVCLRLRTRLGCETRWCREVQVRADSTATGDAIKIVNLYPVPVSVQLTAVVYSRFNNVNSELAIYDVYGVRKWSQNRLLPAGNSTQLVPTSQLANGPYIFRVTTIYGIVSRNFYKLQ